MAIDVDATGFEAAIRLARADGYMQGLKAGRAQIIEELSQIVDDADMIQALLAARRREATDATG